MTPAGASFLRELYKEVDKAVAGLGAACWARGQCCDFERMEHRLYASSLEVEYARAAGPIVGAPDSRLCPFWSGGLCGARAERPLGCRTHFCDSRLAAGLQAIHEAALLRLKRFAEAAGAPWAYGPFVEALRAPGATGAAGGWNA